MDLGSICTFIRIFVKIIIKEKGKQQRQRTRVEGLGSEEGNSGVAGDDSRELKMTKVYYPHVQSVRTH